MTEVVHCLGLAYSPMRTVTINPDREKVPWHARTYTVPSMPLAYLNAQLAKSLMRCFELGRVRRRKPVKRHGTVWD